MAIKENAGSETQSADLSSFNFSNDEEFFGVKHTEDDPTETTINAVKGNATKPDDKGVGASTEIDEVDTLEEDDDEDVTSFFGEEETKPAKKPKKVEATKPQTTTTTVETEEEEEEETEATVKEDKSKVSKKKEEEDVDDESTTGTEEEEEIKLFTTLAKDLKDRKILQSVEVKDGEPVTEDKFFELVGTEIETGIEEGLQAFAETMDEDGKAFVRFKQAGGRTSDFLTHFATGLDIETFDDSDDKQVQQVINYYLTNIEKLDGEELVDRATYIKDSGKQKATATKWFNKIKDEEKERKELILKTVEDNKKKQEDAHKKFAEGLTKVISETETVGVFPITKAEQKELPAYINKPVVKVGKSKYVPQFQSDLSQILRGETVEDQKKLAILAKLVKNNFDIKDLVAKVETKVTKKSKSALASTKINPRPASSASTMGRDLASLF
jgi:hypothetical protein